jgi:hypothetical protein
MKTMWVAEESCSKMFEYPSHNSADTRPLANGAAVSMVAV